MEGQAAPPKTSGAARGHFVKALWQRSLQRRLEGEDETQAPSDLHALRSDLKTRLSDPSSLHAVAAARWAAPTELDVAAWADAHRWLSPEDSPEPGKWLTTRAEYQRGVMLAVSDPAVREVVFQASAQVGKALALDTPIPTPQGWTTMGAVQVGDTIFDDQGQPCRVTFATQTMHGHECFRVGFDNGDEIVADADHLWATEPSGGGWQKGGAYTTRQIAEHMKGTHRSKHAIRLARAWNTTKNKNLPIEPYLLGAWLGDGSSSGSVITQGDADTPDIRAEFEENGWDWKPIARRNSQNSAVYMIRSQHIFTGLSAGKEYARAHYLFRTGQSPFDPRHPSFRVLLRQLGVLYNKHVPSSYLRASIDQRWRLLLGLIDTDGHVTKFGQVEICLSNYALSLGVLELATSLGLKARISQRTTNPGTLAWRIRWRGLPEHPKPKLARKAQRIVEPTRRTEVERVYISAVTPCESVPVRCIQVDSQSHLFLAGRSGIPTHNTNTLINGLGYFIHADPCPMMWISTTIVEVESFAKTRFAAFRRDNPVIAERVLEVGPKKSTLDEWKFPGGRLLFRGSNSPVGLRSNPIRVLIMDEVDGYPYATGEGEPTMLARKRTQVYESIGISKIILASTPADARTSRIAAAYARSDQRKFHVPCPHCGEEQILVESLKDFMETVRWGKRADGSHLPGTAMLYCKSCGAGWTDQQRRDAIAKGRWIAMMPENAGIAGFWLNELYSPFSTIERVVRQFLDAKDEPRKFRQWVNQVLGLVWEDETREGETDWRRLYERREDYHIGVVPEQAVLVTAGVDVQADRLEVEIVAWSPRFESWSIDYRLLRGDPRKEEIWRLLDDLLEERFQAAGGAPSHIGVLGVDAGYATDQVEKWVARKPQRRVIATYGEPSNRRRLDYPIGTPRRVELQKPGRKRQRGIMLYPIGVDWMKEELLHGWLRLEKPTGEELAEGIEHPSGYCHFPRAYGQDYFQQLCSEKKLWTTNRTGTRNLVWAKVHERNEALDCRLIARAAACYAGLDRMAARPRPAMRPAPKPVLVGAAPDEAAPMAEAEAGDGRVVKRSRNRRSGGWLDRVGGSWLDR